MSKKFKIIFLIFFSAFIFLLFAVVYSGGKITIDQQIYLYTKNFHQPVLTEIMLFATLIGSSSCVIFLLALLAVIFWKYKKINFVFILILSAGGGEVLVAGIKHLVTRARPPVSGFLTLADGYSFPSGHSFVAISFYGLLAYLLISNLKNKSKKVAVFCLSLFLILSIGFSRIYLGVHWLTDVLGSYALGLSWLVIVISFWKYFKKHKIFLR